MLKPRAMKYLTVFLALGAPFWATAAQPPLVASRHLALVAQPPKSTTESCDRDLVPAKFQRLLANLWVKHVASSARRNLDLAGYDLDGFLLDARRAGVPKAAAEGYAAEKIESFLRHLDQNHSADPGFILRIFQQYPVDYFVAKDLLSANLDTVVQFANAWSEHRRSGLPLPQRQALNSAFQASLALHQPELTKHILFYFLTGTDLLADWDLSAIEGIQYPDTYSGYVLAHQIGVALQDPTPARMEVIARVAAGIRGLMRKPVQQMLVQFVHHTFVEINKSQTQMSRAELHQSTRAIAQAALLILLKVDSPPNRAVQVMIDQMTQFLIDTQPRIGGS